MWPFFSRFWQEQQILRMLQTHQPSSPSLHRMLQTHWPSFLSLRQMRRIYQPSFPTLRHMRRTCLPRCNSMHHSKSLHLSGQANSFVSGFGRWIAATFLPPQLTILEQQSWCCYGIVQWIGVLVLTWIIAITSTPSRWTCCFNVITFSSGFILLGSWSQYFPTYMSEESWVWMWHIHPVEPQPSHEWLEQNQQHYAVCDSQVGQQSLQPVSM